MSRKIWSEIINDARLYDGSPQMFSELIDRFESKYTISKIEDDDSELDKRRKKFALDISHKKGSYDNAMLRDFFFYWSEHSDKGRKMRFEKEKVFNIELRLARWHKNSKNGTKKGHNISEAKSIADRILSGELS